MDYDKILDMKTKRHILMNEIENINNSIKYYVEEKSEENDLDPAVKVLEEYYQTISEFLESHSIAKV